AAQLAFLIPDQFTGLQVLTYPAFALGISKDVVADQHHTTVLIGHGLVGIDLLRPNSASVHVDANQVTAGTLTGSGVHPVAIHHGRVDDKARIAGLTQVSPGKLSVGCVDAHGALIRHLDVLFLAIDRCLHD